jgi:hypothetical protein
VTIWERWTSLPPAIREPIRSGFVAISIALQTAFFVLVGAAAQAGQIGTPTELLHYGCTHWWGVAVGLVLPAAYRARQGRVAADNTVPLPNGGSAVLIPPKGVS